jgi:hypothetical protein
MKFNYEDYDSEHCVTISVDDKAWVTVAAEAGPDIPSRFEIWEGTGPPDIDEGTDDPEIIQGLLLTVKKGDKEAVEDAWERALFKGHELVIAAIRAEQDQEDREARFTVMIKTAEDKLGGLQRYIDTHFDLSPEDISLEVLGKFTSLLGHLEVALDVADEINDP